MATKAAQRAAMKEKYNRRRAEEKQLGLLALEKDRAKRDEIKHQAEKRAKSKENAAAIDKVVAAAVAAEVGNSDIGPIDLTRQEA